VTWQGDEPEDEPPGRQPLPPDDRIWRHPSELAAGVPAALPRAPARPARLPWWWLVIAFGAGVGATLAGVIISGRLDDDDPVVEQVAPESEDLDPTAVAEQVMDATVHLHVTVDASTRDGSGFVFRDDGHILTSADLVAGATGIEATLHDGTTLDAAIVGTDPVTDLAVVRVDGAEMPTAVLGSAADLQVGERIISVGSAPTAAAPAVVTIGVVQQNGVRLDSQEGPLYDLIAASASSELAAGTALVDQRGAVVGLVSAREGTTRPPEVAGDAHAVPIEAARAVAAELIADGVAHHAWLGAEIPDDQRPPAISSVVEGSPAAVAGLRPTDVIVSVDGAATASGEDVVRAVAAHEPEEQVVIAYERDGAPAQVEVQLAERPATA
jgi:putative serine protease PepD